MTNVEPYIIVKDVEKMAQITYGQAGKIALIGAFPTKDINVEVFTSLDDAMNTLKGEFKLPGDNNPEHASQEVVPTSYTSFYCLPYAFTSNTGSKGPESVLVVNVNYGLDELVQTVDNSKLASACTLLSDEDFDILTVADNMKLATLSGSNKILNPMWATLKSFYNTMYSNQKPFGVITGIEIDDNVTTTVLGSFKTLWDKGIYKAVVTPVKLNGESEALNIAQSGCWHSAFTSGRPVNKSETGKLYPGIIGEDTKSLYPLTENVNWKSFLDNGFLTTKFRNRRLSTIQCLSNVTPADYDMKIERVKNYMIKKLSFQDIFGEDNNKITRAYISSLFEHEKNIAIDNGYLVDMDYNIVSLDTDKVQANLYLAIPDIVRVIELNVTLEIKADMEE